MPGDDGVVLLEAADATPTPFTWNAATVYLSYLSSHDTHLFFEEHGQDVDLQRRAAAVLLLGPGVAQVFYGDETARPFGPTGSDPQQGTRSDVNWDAVDAEVLSHWQTLGTFRRAHAAIGAGAHRHIPFDYGYAFARTRDDDAVLVALLDD